MRQQIIGFRTITWLSPTNWRAFHSVRLCWLVIVGDLMDEKTFYSTRQRRCSAFALVGHCLNNMSNCRSNILTIASVNQRWNCIISKHENECLRRHHNKKITISTSSSFKSVRPSQDEIFTSLENSYLPRALTNTKIDSARQRFSCDAIVIFPITNQPIRESVSRSAAIGFSFTTRCLWRCGRPGDSDDRADDDSGKPSVLFDPSRVRLWDPRLGRARF